MKKTLLLAFLTLCVSSIAFAQYDPGSIDVYSGQGQASCNFVDAGGLVSVYLFHTHTDGSTASQFKLETPPSAVWQHFGDLWQFQTVIGSSPTGVSLGYGSCLGQLGDIYLGAANFNSTTPAGVCDLISIVPDPTAPSGLVEFVDCAAVKWTKDRGGQGRVNSDGSCDCSVPVRETTWGGIKALYN
jgi:hypothetical protein